jgi:hypothetical protein
LAVSFFFVSRRSPKEKKRAAFLLKNFEIFMRNPKGADQKNYS